MHDQTVLTAEELNKKLHEDVEDVSLVNVSDRVAHKRPLGVDYREERRARVHRDHGENSYYLQLDGRLSVIAQVLEYLVAGNTAGQHGENGAEVVHEGCMARRRCTAHGFCQS